MSPQTAVWPSAAEKYEPATLREEYGRLRWNVSRTHIEYTEELGGEGEGGGGDAIREYSSLFRRL